MSQYLQALGKVLHHIARETLERTPIPLGNWVYPYQPGDEVWVEDWKLLWAHQCNKPEFSNSPSVVLGFSSTGFCSSTRNGSKPFTFNLRTIQWSEYIVHKKADTPRDDIAFPRSFNREMVNLLKDVEALTIRALYYDHVHYKLEAISPRKAETDIQHDLMGPSRGRSFPHILCFSFSLKYTDNSIWCTFPEIFYRCQPPHAPNGKC